MNGANEDKNLIQVTVDARLILKVVLWVVMLAILSIALFNTGDAIDVLGGWDARTKQDYQDFCIDNERLYREEILDGGGAPTTPKARLRKLRRR